jgi:hypothetical protein
VKSIEQRVKSIEGSKGIKQKAPPVAGLSESKYFNYSMGKKVRDHL